MSMSETNHLIKKMDWPLLQMQKHRLVKMLDEQSPKAKRKHAYMQGLVCLLDYLQDAAVEDGLATEDEVFDRGRTPEFKEKWYGKTRGETSGT